MVVEWVWGVLDEKGQNGLSGINPYATEATFVQSTRTQCFLKNT